MHHLPVRRRGLDAEGRELLELCADGWSTTLIAAILEVGRAEADARLRALCPRLGMAPRPDGRPPVHAARMWLVEDARRQAALGPLAA
jgi:hypothetical protein